MKAMSLTFGAVLAAVLSAPTANAQNFGPCPRQAPDCCGGPSYYAPNWFGAYYGPNYNLYPGNAPYSGPVGFPSFTMQGNGSGGGFGGVGVAPPLSFPTHPYARSPRDFFMVDDEPARYPVSSAYGLASQPAPPPVVPQNLAPLTPPPPPVAAPVAPPPITK